MNEEHETEQKPTSNPNPAERRNSLFAYLGHAIRLSHEKMSSRGNSDSAKHGEILSGCLLIYDENELDAWATFEHEVYECKFKEVTYAYRTVINGMIDAVEKIAYERKEKFLEFLPRISEVIREEQARTKPDKKQ